MTFTAGGRSVNRGREEWKRFRSEGGERQQGSDSNPPDWRYMDINTLCRNVHINQDRRF